MDCLCSTEIIGPALFGGIYALTVGTYPHAVLIAPVVVISVALVCSMLIRLPKEEAEREV